MNKRVLLVDDEKNVLRGYKRMLRKSFDVITAESAKEALSIIKTQKKFAVIVSDLKMAETDGYKLLSIVKETSPDTIRIMLSQYGELVRSKYIEASGFVFKFLEKPCYNQTLKATLEEAIELFNMKK